MPQIIHVGGEESPLYQALSGLSRGLQIFVQLKELKRRQEAEQRRLAMEEGREERVAAAQEFGQRLLEAKLRRDQAAETPIAEAPLGPWESAGDAAPRGTLTLPDETEVPFAPRPMAVRGPLREINLRTPDGRVIPLAPLKYREEAQAQDLQARRERTAAEAEVMDVPDDAEMYGTLAGQRGVRVSAVNSYIQANQRRDAAEANRIAREAVAESAKQARQAAIDARTAAAAEKKADKEAEVDAWVDSLASGEKVLADVPATMKGAVLEKANRLKVSVATKRLGERAIERLTDSQTLLSRLDDLGSLESGFGQWVQQKVVPDVITQMTGLGVDAKSSQAAYFMYTAETLKAIQGSRPSDFDMKSYLANMPKISDPPDVKAKKVARLRKQLTDRYNTVVGTFRKQGYSVSGFEVVGEPEAAAAPARRRARNPQTGEVVEWDGSSWVPVR